VYRCNMSARADLFAQRSVGAQDEGECVPVHYEQAVRDGVCTGALWVQVLTCSHSVALGHRMRANVYRCNMSKQSGTECVPVHYGCKC